MGLASGKLEASSLQNIYELLQEDQPNIEKYNQIAQNIIEINCEVDFSLLNEKKNLKNKNINYLLIIFKDFLMSYIRELNLITSDETYKNENLTLIQIQTRTTNLVNCLMILIGYMDRDDLWKPKDGNTPIAINLFEACSVLLFSHKYSVICDREKPPPESPVNMNQQTLWKKPENAYEELSNEYLMLLKNRTKVLDLVLLLFQKSEQESNLKESKEILKQGNCAINLFSHRLSKNIFNTLYSCLTIIYSDSNVLIHTNFYDILRNYKKSCAKLLGLILANSYFKFSNSLEDQLIIQYYQEKMTLLNPEKLSKELLKECEEPLKYSHLLLSSVKPDTIERFFDYFFLIFHHYNKFFYNNIKSNAHEHNEFLTDADSGYLLNL